MTGQEDDHAKNDFVETPGTRPFGGRLVAKKGDTGLITRMKGRPL